MPKLCTACKKERPDDYFLGRRGMECKQCKVCRARAKNWFEIHKKEVLEKEKEKYWNNKELYSERNKAYYARNRETILEKVRIYYRENTETSREAQKRYRKNNSDKMRELAKKTLREKVQFSLYADRLVIDDGAICGENGILYVACTFCKKLYAPSRQEVSNRIASLKTNSGSECRFYCCKLCKQSCPIFASRIDPVEKVTRKSNNPKWRNAVLDRADRTCELCGSKEKLEAHHILAKSRHKNEEVNVENGVCLCCSCHLKIHRQKGCSFSDLKNK